MMNENIKTVETTLDHERERLQAIATSTNANVVELVDIFTNISKLATGEEAVALVAEFGYKKAYYYQLLKLGKRFGSDILTRYGAGLLLETNTLPDDVAVMWVMDGKINGMTAKEVRELVKQYKADNPKTSLATRQIEKPAEINPILSTDKEKVEYHKAMARYNKAQEKIKEKELKDNIKRIDREINAINEVAENLGSLFELVKNTISKLPNNEASMIAGTYKTAMDKLNTALTDVNQARAEHNHKN